MSSNPWASATRQALEIRRSALDQVAGTMAGQVSHQDQAARYLHFKNNPQDLVNWSAQHNGPDQALPQATRYMAEMRKRYGD